MRCDAAQSLLQPYLDGELDRAGVGEIEAHLTGCESCRRELAALEHLRANLKSAPRFRAPRSLRAQLQSIDDLHATTTNVRSFMQWRPSAIAASILLAFILGGAVTWFGATSSTRAGQQQAFAHELLTSHLRALAAVSPVDVISEDRHTVKPWFAGRIGESPPVKDLSQQGFPLVGGRIDYVGDRRTAVIVYRHRQHVIDVYVTAPTGERAAPTTLQLQGYWVAPCRIGENLGWIVTDTEQDQVVQLCKLLAENSSRS